MTDKHLDDAIDRAVREMMSGEPASDLRQRVLDTITRPRRRAIAWSALAYGSAALAAIVLLVVSLVTRRPDVPETRVAGTTTVAPARPPRPRHRRSTRSPHRSRRRASRAQSFCARPRGTSTPPSASRISPIAGWRPPRFLRRARARIRDDRLSAARARRPARHCHDRRAADRDERDRIAPITIGRIEIAPLPPRDANCISRRAHAQSERSQ